MNTKERYSLILLVSLLCCCAFIAYRKSYEARVESSGQFRTLRRMKIHSRASTFLNRNDENELLDVREMSSRQRGNEKRQSAPTKCTMETCFDFTNCKNDFKVYIYGSQPEQKLSATYSKMIQILKESKYYTADPKTACLFIPSLDTLDRDKLSKDFVEGLEHKIAALPFWNGGRNHVIFNLFSGTWPDYTEKLGFDINQAILAKASLTSDIYRPEFDVSLPLFPRNHPTRAGGNLPHNVDLFPIERKYRLAFKGKRYLHGIGSESRNALYHIHNGKDIVLLTTCKHGKWERLKDSRCDIDNSNYDRYDYEELLMNSSFCLVPRGRRLGSFRFLETLKVGCVPVLLSNGWELPFSEVIDWRKALVEGDERLLTQIPSIVRWYSSSEILLLKQQGLFLWESYFSSIEKIVLTTLEIIRSRIIKHKSAGAYVWNHFPGSLKASVEYSRHLPLFPFFQLHLGVDYSRSKFTAVIFTMGSVVKDSSPLSRLIKHIAQSKHLDRIIVLWTSGAAIPSRRKWPQINVTLVIVRSNSKTPNRRFTPRDMIETDAIFSVDENVRLSVDEINFAFSVWKSFPSRLVGFQARDHYWDEGVQRWTYSSMWSNEYSMVLTSSVFYHRYYNHMYTHLLPHKVHKMVDHQNTCEGLAMNFLVADTIKLPPIKVLSQKLFQETMNPDSARFAKQAVVFHRRRKCMNTLTEVFGYMPLIKSRVRFDPLLYRDPVSNLRKRYKLLEV